MTSMWFLIIHCLFLHNCGTINLKVCRIHTSKPFIDLFTFLNTGLRKICQRWDRSQLTLGLLLCIATSLHFLIPTGSLITGFQANLKQVNYLTLFRESFQYMQVREQKFYAFIRGMLLCLDSANNYLSSWNRCAGLCNMLYCSNYECTSHTGWIR